MPQQISQKKSRLVISFSLLTLWNSGRWEDAISMYFHKDTKKSRQMSEGLEYHHKWEDSIKKDKTLTVGGCTLKFNSPKCEVKKLVNYSEQFDLSGIFDCIDGETLYEWKTGVASSSEYTNGNQLPFYFLIAKLEGTPIEKGVLMRYNQYEKEADLTVLWNSDEQIEKAKNFIDSLAPDILTYWTDHKLPFDKMKGGEVYGNP